MKAILRRTWAPILAVALAQLLINSRPVAMASGGVDSRLLAKAFLFLALFLVTSFAGGAVHAALLRRRSDAGLSMCFLDGAVIGLLSNLSAQLLSLAAHGSGLDLVLRPAGGPDPVLWFSKLVLGFVIVMIFGFVGLLCGGAGGGLVGLVSIWTSGSTTKGEKHG